MTTKNVMRVMIAAALALTAASAQALEMHGYFRESLGVNSKGGGMVCYQLPGSYFKARLGNECDRYLEMDIAETGKIGDVEWRYEFMPNQFQDNVGGADSGNGLGVAQSWAGLKFNEWGGATVWAGRRYFKRHDVHSLDWFYWNPGQGNTAVGIEDIGLGFGKFAAAVIRMEADADVVHGVYVVPDLRLYDIAVNPGGTLEVGVDLALANDQDDAAGDPSLGVDRSGVSPLFTLQHNQANVLGGSNTLAFQYGAGAFAKENGGGPGQLLSGGTSDDKQWRVIEHLVINPSPQLSAAFVLVYQDVSAANDLGGTALSVEVRPSFQPTEYFKVSLDLFYQSIKPDFSGADTASLTKVTLAPTIVLGHGYYARPELRFFVTYGAWNDGAVALAGETPIANGAFGDKKNGLSIGAQMEMWF